MVAFSALQSLQELFYSLHSLLLLLTHARTHTLALMSDPIIFVPCTSRYIPYCNGKAAQFVNRPLATPVFHMLHNYHLDLLQLSASTCLVTCAMPFHNNPCSTLWSCMLHTMYVDTERLVQGYTVQKADCLIAILLNKHTIDTSEILMVCPVLATYPNSEPSNFKTTYHCTWSIKNHRTPYWKSKLTFKFFPIENLVKQQL